MRASKYNSLMDLAGQGASAGSRPLRSRILDDQGYLMAVLLIGMAITAVWMSALLPAWRQQVTRQREQDLIFRGEQYARAVALYVMKNRCALPTNVDDLVAQKYLRKKWKDPITNDDFILVPGAQPGQGGAPQPGGRRIPGGSGGRRRRAAGGAARAHRCRACGRGRRRSRQEHGPGWPERAANDRLAVGRVSRSEQPEQPIDHSRQRHRGRGEQERGTSIMIYIGQQTYSAWQFMYTNELRKMGQQPQCGQGQPGARPGTQPGQPGGVVAAARPGGPGGPTRTGGPGDGRGRGGELPPPPPPGGIGRGRGGGGVTP